jgi:hypothetical protein
MAAILTFYPRRGLLEATASGQAFRVPVYRDHTRILAWEKIQELRPGKVTLWDHAFELPGGELDRGATVTRRVALEARDFPEAGDAFHSHAATALYVGTRSSGIHVDGLPVCNRRTCIIVLQHWDELRRAIAGEKRLSFSISP